MSRYTRILIYFVDSISITVQGTIMDSSTHLKKKNHFIRIFYVPVYNSIPSFPLRGKHYPEFCLLFFCFSLQFELIFVFLLNIFPVLHVFELSINIEELYYIYQDLTSFSLTLCFISSIPLHIPVIHSSLIVSIVYTYHYSFI